MQVCPLFEVFVLGGFIRDLVYSQRRFAMPILKVGRLVGRATCGLDPHFSKLLRSAGLCGGAQGPLRSASIYLVSSGGSRFAEAHWYGSTWTLLVPEILISPHLNFII